MYEKKESRIKKQIFQSVDFRIVLLVSTVEADYTEIKE